MNRPFLVCVLLALTAGGLGAQQSSQSSSYEGTSNPPPDDTIVTDAPAQAKPPAGHVAQSSQRPQNGQAQNGQIDPGIPASDQWQGGGAANAGQGQSYPTPNASQSYPQQTYPVPPDMANSPTLQTRPQGMQRAYASDPDGDIVHPEVLQPGELGAGTTIRVRLMERLSTTESQTGEAFRTRVGSDVVLGGQVLIPAGAEIDGRLAEVSKGHVGGYGTIRLRPETVIMPNGQRYRLYAEVTATPGSSNRVIGEGTIRPGSRAVKDGVEYGAGVGGGAVAGALIGGPVGALTGSVVAAGMVTVHLLANHPQATLDPGTPLQFTLTEPLFLSSVNLSGN